MKSVIAIIAGILFPMLNYCQEFRKPMSEGLVNIIEVDEISVKGYDGSEIIITAPDRKKDNDDKAEGLRVLSSSGLFDNTGLGLSILEQDGVMTIQQVNQSWNHEEYKLQIPKNLSLYLEHSDASGKEIVIENMEGEIEVSCNYNDVYLEDIFGPMAIKTVYGDIEAEYLKLSQVGSHSLYSVYGSVDVSIPETSQANVSLNSDYGSLYSNLEVDIGSDNDLQQPNNRKTHKKSCTTEFIEGLLNGGGVKLNLKSNYDNIYLRSN